MFAFYIQSGLSGDRGSNTIELRMIRSIYTEFFQEKTQSSLFFTYSRMAGSAWQSRGNPSKRDIRYGQEWALINENPLWVDYKWLSTMTRQIIHPV